MTRHYGGAARGGGHKHRHGRANARNVVAAAATDRAPLLSPPLATPGDNATNPKVAGLFSACLG
jgi:hypothetical protein